MSAIAVQEFVAHSSAVNAATISRTSGKLIATGSDDRRVNVWAVGSPNVRASLTGHTSGVESVEFDAAERMVVSGSASGVIKVWDIDPSKMKRSLAGHKANVTCLHFHPYGEFVASGSNDTNLKIWDIRRKGCIQTYRGHLDSVTSVRCSPDGRWVVTGSADAIVRLWDLTAGRKLAEFKGHTGAVTDLQFHPSEFLLASSSQDRTVRFWDLERFECVTLSQEDAVPIKSIAFHPEGSALFSAGKDHFRAHAWEPYCTLDGNRTGWGNILDVHCIAEKNRLVGVSALKEKVSLWSVDLSEINLSRDDASSRLASRAQSAVDVPSERALPEVASRPQSKGPAVQDQPRASRAQRSSVTSDRVERRQPPSPRRERRSVPTPPSTRDQTPADPFVSRPRVVDDRKPSTPISSDTVTLQRPASSVTTGETSPNAKENHGPSQPNTAVGRSPEHAHWSKNDARPVLSSKRSRPPTAALARVKSIPDGGAASAADIQAMISSGHDDVLEELHSRMRNVKIVKTLWEQGKHKQALEKLVDMEDNASLVDVLNILVLNPSQWTLDMAVTVLPNFDALFSSEADNFINTASEATLLILRSFGQLIADTIKAPPTGAGIDLTGEERYEKCSSCQESFTVIREAIDRLPPKRGKVAAQLKKVTRALDLLAAS